MPPGLPQAQLVIWSLAFLAAPGLLLPVKFGRAYLGSGSDPQSIVHGLLVFRLFFITLTMTTIGMVALVIWDGMFPDRRDARILTGLPLPGRVLIGARLLALSALCGIFVVGVNAVPAVTYAPMIAVFGGAANMVLGVAGFIVANALAGAFVFSTLVALQGIVLNLGGRRAADRMSLVLQVTFVMVLLQMVLFMPRLGSMLTSDLSSGWVRAMPSVWFLGLYDVIGGRPVAGSPSLAGIALLATATTVGSAILLFVSTHARLTRRALESRETGTGNGRRRRDGGQAHDVVLQASSGAGGVRVHGSNVKQEPQPSAADGHLRGRWPRARRLWHRAGCRPRWVGRVRHARRRALVRAARHRLLRHRRHAGRGGDSGRAEGQLAVSLVRASRPRAGDGRRSHGAALRRRAADDAHRPGQRRDAVGRTHCVGACVRSAP